MRALWTEMQRDGKIKIIVFFLFGGLFLINILLNYQYLAGDRVLYSDELEGYINTYHNCEKSMWDKIWGNDVIRPIPHLLLIIIYSLAGKNYTIFSWILLGNNFLLAMLVFGAVYFIQAENKDMVRRLILSGIGGTLYLMSRFFQCHIVTVLGIMEGIAHGAVLLMVMLLVAYIRTNHIKYFYFTIFSWLIALYCHERYFGLIAVLLLVCLYKWQYRKKEIGITIIIGVLYWLQRMLTLTDSLRGTGRVSITDSFSIASFFKLAVSQIAYIMGINAGPEIINGVNYRDVPIQINLFILIYIICVLAICILFIFLVVTKKEYKRKDFIFENILILFAIGCCIVQSSVTTTVALRFVYVSYSLFIILLLRMISYIFKYGNSNIIRRITVFMVCSLIIFEVYYRGEIKNVGFYKHKVFSESLYEITIKRYGKAFAKSKVIVINNYQNWSEEKWKEFFQPYVETNTMMVVYYDSILELMSSGIDTEGWIIIFEDEESNMCYEISQKALMGQDE